MMNMRPRWHKIAVVGGIPLLCLLLCWTLWTLFKPKLPRDVLNHNGDVLEVTFSPDGRYIATTTFGGECDLYIWDARKGDVIRHLTGCPDKRAWPINSISYSPDGKYLVITRSPDEIAWIRDAESGEYIRPLEGHTDYVFGASFNHDGTLVVTSSADRTARVWNVETASEILQLGGHEGLGGATFSPDGRLIATENGSEVRIWDVASGEKLTRLTGHEGGIYVLEFSPDGNMIVTASNDSTARLWDVRSGTEIRRFEVPGDWLRYAFYDSAKHRVITLGMYSDVRIWDAETGKVLTRFSAAGGRLGKAAVSPDRSLLATSYDKKVRVWSLDD